MAERLEWTIAVRRETGEMVDIADLLTEYIEYRGLAHSLRLAARDAGIELRGLERKTVLQRITKLIREGRLREVDGGRDD